MTLYTVSIVYLPPPPQAANGEASATALPLPAVADQPVDAVLSSARAPLLPPGLPISIKYDLRSSADPTAADLGKTFIPEFAGLEGNYATLRVTVQGVTVANLPTLVKANAAHHGRPVPGTEHWWEFENPWFWEHPTYWYKSDSRILTTFDVADQAVRTWVEHACALPEAALPNIETYLGFPHAETTHSLTNPRQEALFTQAPPQALHQQFQDAVKRGRTFGVIFLDLVTARALRQLHRNCAKNFVNMEAHQIGWKLLARYPVHHELDSMAQRRVKATVYEASALHLAGRSDASPYSGEIAVEYRWVVDGTNPSTAPKLAKDAALSALLATYYAGQARKGRTLEITQPDQTIQPQPNPGPVLSSTVHPVSLRRTVAWLLGKLWILTSFGAPLDFIERLDTRHEMYRSGHETAEDWAEFIQQIISERQNANTVSGLILAAAGAFLAIPDLVDFARFPTIVSTGFVLSSIVLGFNYRISEQLMAFPKVVDLRRTQNDKNNIRLLGSVLNAQITLLNLSVLSFFVSVFAQVLFAAGTSTTVTAGTGADTIIIGSAQCTADLESSGSTPPTISSQGNTVPNSGSNALIFVPHVFSALAAGFFGITAIYLFYINWRKSIRPPSYPN
ncbi:hypothetical protein DFH08DRAFT_986081 [Mycena albidolilacea]|uniref:Uncharacterized protein n=1 Tax=Mycena albidolilacea TaxID=1033008 RepID=A0AAD6Z2G6_9AGAR|nr:hypothetical protein DFH08DRAFT_986081 [Mycena albidolilacea]